MAHGKALHGEREVTGFMTTTLTILFGLKSGFSPGLYGKMELLQGDIPLLQLPGISCHVCHASVEGLHPTAIFHDYHHYLQNHYTGIKHCQH